MGCGRRRCNEEWEQNQYHRALGKKQEEKKWRKKQNGKGWEK